MPLIVGTKLGAYEILGPLGAGGMGEVYRALDTQLEREVAVKVLPHAMASDPERLARFDREAKILAALNHPNIAVIYGLVQFDGGRALVMELVPGETLGDRIRRGALPPEDASKLATQIAEALEAAHEKGIVHRDLKPGNVMITPGGVVKVLDFGLAAMALPAASGDADNSPTLTMGMTQAGTIMGTAAYMSPEQAAGLPVDKRADIWSYGVVLWEMVSGKRLFGGVTISHTLADVLRAPIDSAALNAPAQLKGLLRRCLDRDVRTRLRDIGEARVAIAEYLADPKSGVENLAQAASLPGRQNISRVAWGVAALAIVGAGVLGWKVWSAPPAVGDRALIRFSVDLGPEAMRSPRNSMLLSADGTRLVFTARAANGLEQLYTRLLNQPNATPLPGTNEVLDHEAFISPDGQWVGFWNVGRISKIAVQGGSPITLVADAALGSAIWGGSWGDDDNIILGSIAGLWRMPGSGGSTQLVKGTAGVHVFPQVLPGSAAVLVNTSLSAASLEGLDVAVLDFATGEEKVLIKGGYFPRYMPTGGANANGHLVYMHEGTLFAVGFNPRSLVVLGTPVPLLDDVAASAALNNGGGQFTFSNTGTFAYLSGRADGSSYPISTLDAAGKTGPLLPQTGNYGAPRLSPDGKHLAYLAPNSKGSDLWVYDMERSTPTQLTFLGGVNSEVAWARDSKHLVYSEGAALWWNRADGAGQRQQLLDKATLPRPFSFAPDGRLAYALSVGGLPDVWTLPIDQTDPEHPKPGKAEAFLADPGIVEVDPAFSPDGKFLAYASNESGTEEVFVRPFPGPGGKWKVSTKGGKFPTWSAATHELLFIASDDRIMAAAYSTQGDSFTATPARQWSPTAILRTNVQQNFDVFPDGKRIVMFPKPAAETTGGNLHATFLLNFFDEVRRRVPVK
ncbi:MAG: protein kinase [Acidobacteriota bacterium]